MIKYKKNSTTETLIAKKEPTYNKQDFGYAENTTDSNVIATNSLIASELNETLDTIVTKAKERTDVNKKWDNTFHLRVDENVGDGLTNEAPISSVSYPTIKTIEPQHLNKLKGAGTIIENGNNLSLSRNSLNDQRSWMGLSETLPIDTLQEEGGMYVAIQDFEWTDLGSGPFFFNLWIINPVITTSQNSDLWIEDSSNERMYLYWDSPNDEDPVGLPLEQARYIMNMSTTTTGRLVNGSKSFYEPVTGATIGSQDTNYYVYFTPGIYRFYYTAGNFYLLPGQSIVKLQLKSKRSADASNTSDITCGLIDYYSDGFADVEYYMDSYSYDDLSNQITSDTQIYWRSPVLGSEVNNGVLYRKASNASNSFTNAYWGCNVGANDAFSTLYSSKLSKGPCIANGHNEYGAWHTYYGGASARNMHVKERLWLF